MKDIRVISIVDSNFIYINKGRKQGIQGHEIILIFKLDEEIFYDNESLGQLEIPLGIFKVSKIEKNRSLLTLDQINPFTNDINIGDFGKVINYANDREKQTLFPIFLSIAFNIIAICLMCVFLFSIFHFLIFN